MTRRTRTAGVNPEPSLKSWQRNKAQLARGEAETGNPGRHRKGSHQDLKLRSTELTSSTRAESSRPHRQPDLLLQLQRIGPAGSLQVTNRRTWIELPDPSVHKCTMDPASAPARSPAPCHDRYSALGTQHGIGAVGKPDLGWSTPMALAQTPTVRKCKTDPSPASQNSLVGGGNTKSTSELKCRQRTKKPSSK